MIRCSIRGLVARCALALVAGVLGGAAGRAEGANGACCQSGFACTIGDRGTCLGAGGVYIGDNTACTPANPCVQLLGACCVVEAIVRTTSPVSEMGPPDGCSKCPPPPVMCRSCSAAMAGFPGATFDFQNFRSVCVISTHAGCTYRNGFYRGDGTACLPNPCPVPPPAVGACCSLDAQQRAVCRQDTPAGCASGYATFVGLGVACSATACPQPGIGACCRVAGGYVYCGMTSAANCAFGGKYEGDGVACTPTRCPPPVRGTCCRPASATRGSYCVVETDYTCFGGGATFTPSAGTCATSTCARSCPCDWDRNGYLSANDLTVFLNDWLAGHADYNNSGGTDIQDYTEFVNCYLGTSASCIRG